MIVIVVVHRHDYWLAMLVAFLLLETFIVPSSVMNDSHEGERFQVIFSSISLCL